MGDGYTVDVDQLRTHAGNLDSLKERFAAVKSASSHIAQDDQAYGLLCGWISAIMEGRHQKQDELISYVEENLAIAAVALRASADHYEDKEAVAATKMNQIKNDLGAPR
jgi:hypothetical protein